MSETHGKTVWLRTALKSSLDTLANNVYYGSAPDTITPPYVIFNVEEVLRSDDVTSCELELNVIDISRNTAACEDLCDAISAYFDHKYYEDAHIAYASWYDRKNNVYSEDRNIIRRRLMFELKFYNKEI